MVATMLVDSPMTSSRKGPLPVPTPLSRTLYQRIVRGLKFKCYHPRLVHGSIEDDSDRRSRFCELLLNEIEHNDSQICERIIWTDEAQSN